LVGEQRGKVFPLKKKLTIGRVSANDITIKNHHVSRHHAEILQKGSSHQLLDLRSSNGTFVNNALVEEHTLQHGDEIRIADHFFVFLAQRDQAPAASHAENMMILSDSDRGRTISVDVSMPPQDRTLISPDAEQLKTDFVARLRKNIDVLHDMAQIMATDVDRSDLLKKITDMLVDSFDAERACILLWSESANKMVPGAVTLRRGVTDRRLSLSKTIVERVEEKRVSLLCKDASADARLGKAESVRAGHVRSVLCTPLLIRDQLLGLLYLDNRSLPNEFNEEDLHLLMAVARQTAVMVESHHLLSTMRNEVRYLQERADVGEGSIIGESPTINEVVATARRAAESNATVLLLGESGTGKEVLARSIHRWSDRRSGPFVVVNCAALTDQLLQSDLFGHERGAFTGAIKRKSGKLEVADGGTAFLDEIGELPLDMQVKLLRFLQEREFERVGGTHPIHVDVRVIAATNKDLGSEVESRRFREDLYYRLQVIEICMPPLRKRRGDIPLLARQFLHEYAKDMNKQLSGFSKGAMDLLREHSWPGNIRELRNAVERAAVLSSGPMIDVKDLSGVRPRRTIRMDETLTGFYDQVKESKRQIIQDALDKAGGVKGDAAELLGLRLSYLSRLMKNLGMR
jgi:transcriptional regulator with GAF, ATPase, and Fis domain